MKPDEKLLWESFGAGTPNATPRDAMETLNMPLKRVIYLCEKWAKQKIYEYGVASDLGWKLLKGEN